MERRRHKAMDVAITLALVAMLASSVLTQRVHANPDTETLRPNAVGDATNISSQEPSSGPHWDKVDETTADDLSTYVYTTSTSYEQDLYHIPDHSSGSGTINSVTVYFRFANSAARTYAIAYTGVETDGFLKTVDIRADGEIDDTVIDTLEFEGAEGLYPNIIPVSGDVYAIAYSGPGASTTNDGFLTTVEIATNGQITDTLIHTLTFDSSNGQYPNIIHVSGNVYAIAYSGQGQDGFVKTVGIDANGTITDSANEFEFYPADVERPNIIHASGDVYAIAYKGAGGNGYLTTVEIYPGGTIKDTVDDTLVFDTFMGHYPNIIHVSGNIYAIAYKGAYYEGEELKTEKGVLKTVEIDSGGNITDDPLDTLHFDTTYCEAPNIIHVSGDVYAIAYPGGSYNGFLKTVEIYGSGLIKDTVNGTLEFDTTNGEEPNIIHVLGDVYAIAYDGSLAHGYLKTVEIATSGTITDSGDTLQFDTSAGQYPKIILVYATGTVYARAAIKTYGTVDTGTEESTSSDTSVTRAYQWTKNPSTDSDWTWAEIDALQIGVELKTDDIGDTAAGTQVYAVIDYSTAVSQTWYLSGTTGSWVMYKGDAAQPADTVTVVDDQFQIWRADEAATASVTFPAGTWTGHITFDGGSLDTTVRVYVGKWDGADFTPSGDNEYADVSSSSDFEVSASQFTVPETNWLASKIEDYDAVADSDSVIVSVGSNNSYVTSPSSDPGYPVHELPAIILLGAGLAGLGGYVAFIRRRKRQS